ncbi:hypothetical protein SEA_LILBEANIE_62 [Gordonia phage Lilbeanie]|uniref:Uncharacterized protein n=1 Tax=Gordonia phage Lilbeanie TaxID=2794947 RepID=A0A7T1NXL3_9CAUD|nr:hypothetical protein J1773_gp62 [Gordonia phage Lilbeanie]QPO17140.1 hypothetical protein SEA_LILBEANIE_62 [Gordonia phage Lilbeanie]
MTRSKQLLVTPIIRRKDAIQWDGTLWGAEEVARVLNGRVIVTFVPRGYEHYLREDHTGEFDRSRGDVLPDAPAFLSVHRSAASGAVRYPEGTWFIWDDERGDDVEIITSHEFDKLYTIHQESIDGK